MKWILVVYFAVGVWQDSHYTYYANKKDCMEQLHEIQKRPEHYYQAWCKPVEPTP